MTRTLLTGLAAVALATPAAAHTGAHGKSVMTEITHWLSSPIHSGGTILALVALVTVAYIIKRRKA
ncbi:PGF-CTERM sorting domain-containing protein [Litorimonas sp. WD9-15]|uniref:PGF-CTERM sorting domain-containing protein n=1 Tax=Litorimonas sp. WD9-15 TaxID=3418716 RepID=UPI003D07F9C5